MKTNELRIGNWVIVKPFTHNIGEVNVSHEHPQICQITGIQKIGDSVIVYETDNILAPMPIEHIMGVPLSEKILSKGEFLQSHNNHGNTFHILREGYIVDYTIEHWTNTDSETYKNRFHAEKVGKVEFLHEIQNAIFILLKKELDFSFLCGADVFLHFEESNPEPLAVNITLSDD